MANKKAKAGEAAKGALGGAATGAAVGSVVPGIGTAAGAIAGGLIGGIGGWMGGDGPAKSQYGGVNKDNYRVHGFGQQYRGYGDLADQYGGRQADQIGFYGARGSSFRGGQEDLARMLMAQANGQGPGQELVRQQAQDAADRGVAQQMAMANSGRPGQGAGAFRNAAMNAGNMQSQVGGQAAQAGLQAQLGAMGQLGGVLQGARGQDQDLNMFNQSQRQSANQFNADINLRQMGLNDQSQLEALRQRLALAGMDQQGGMAYEQNRAGRYAADKGVASGPSFGDQMLGAGGGALSAYLQYKGTRPA